MSTLISRFLQLSVLAMFISNTMGWPTVMPPEITIPPLQTNRGAARQMYGSGSLRQAGSSPILYSPGTVLTRPPPPVQLSSGKAQRKTGSLQGSAPNSPSQSDDNKLALTPAPQELPGAAFRNGGAVGGIRGQTSNGNYGGLSNGPIGTRTRGDYVGRSEFPGLSRGELRPGGMDRVDVPYPHHPGDIVDSGRLGHGGRVMNPEQQLLASDEGGTHPCGKPCPAEEFLCNKTCTCILKSLRCNGKNDCPEGEDEAACENTTVSESTQYEESLFFNSNRVGGVGDHCEESDSKVRCPLSGKCISKEWLCDVDDDCGDFTDESHCGPNSTCNDDQYECANGICIPQSWVCDDENDCRDFSDEINCTRPACTEHQFTCGDGSCVTLTFKCDKEPDCPDGSDEDDCEREPQSCSEDEFQCATGSKCIKGRFRCDGDSDCEDSSDEENCSKATGRCSSGEFKCADGKCIPAKFRCDRERDCEAGEDETFCPTHKPPTCSSDDYTCDDGRCILKTWICDGVSDCLQGEDERNCEIFCEEGQFTCQPMSNISVDERLCVNRKYVCDGQKDCPRGEDELLCPTRRQCERGSLCAQQCIRTADGVRACSCKPGYKLDKNGYSCNDIDECLFEMYPVCSQTCHNTVGSFTCSCMTGYVLRPDLRTCKALGATPTLLFANRDDIRQVSLGSNRYSALLKGLHNAIALDYHYKKGIIIWSEVSNDVIKRANINGTGGMKVIKWGLESPAGVAIDWIHNLMFWTDSGTRRVEVSSLDGALRAVVAASDLDKPRAIAVHPGEAYVFWTDWGPNPKIERADMDGSHRHSIVTEFLFWPNGLTLDYTASRVYWADAKHHIIECARFDGSERKKVISKSLPHPFAITIFGDAIYWTDWHTKSISTANKVTGAGIRTVFDGLHFPMDIHSYHPLRQPNYTSHCPTTEALGKCSHLCLPNHEGYRCACPMGLTLLNDGKICSTKPDKILLFARKKDIRLRQLEPNKKSMDVDMVIPVEGIKSAVALAWDTRTDSIFWTDVEKDTINKAHLNGSQQSVILHSNLISPAGLALDWLTNKLYWTDAGTNRIEVSDTDGRVRALLVWDGLDKPRDIVVDPNAGYMYWSDWGYVPKIERAAMDGSARETLFLHNLTWPNGLAIDHEQGRLYWTDGGTKAIEYANMDGTGRTVLIGSDLPHPFGLDVFKTEVYWTDWETSSIQSANKLTGKGRQILGSNIPGLMDVRVFHRDRKYTKTPCDNLNGGCSHLCLLKPRLQYSCACPIGVKIGDDNKTCANGPVNSLIFAHRVDIRQISLDVPYIVDVVLPLPPLKHALAVDVDRKTGLIYWTDTKEDVIHRATPDGKNVTSIIQDGLETADGIAVDTTGRKLYWTDSGRHSIEVAELNGRNRKVLFWSDLDSPRAIVLHYNGGMMYWSDWGGSPRIEMACMDGTKRQILIVKGLGWPNGLAIDKASDRLYWNDGQRKTIESSDLQGENRVVVVTEVPHPYGLVVVGSHIYWTDWKTEAVHRADKTNGTNKTIIRDKLEGLMDIRSIQPDSLLENVCGTNNGGCSHLCLRNNEGFSCVCPTGVLMEEDSNTNCQKMPSTYLLFATRNSLARISLDITEPWDVALPIDDVHNPISVDFHWEKKMIFYSDVTMDVIRSVNMYNLSDVRTVVEGNLDTPNGLGVDWVANNIYWSDNELKVIEVARLDGSYRKVLIHENLDEPRALALYPEKGYLYWTDWGKVPKIERTSLDGSNRRIIITGDLGFPNGLAIDYGDNRLYWADALKDRIETSDLHGGHRTQLVPDAKHPFGLTQFGKHIYWTDWYKKSVMRADKTTGNGVTAIKTDLAGVMEIRAVSPSRQDGWNPCGDNNGGCSHLCLFICPRQGYVCACPDNPEGGECRPDTKTVKSVKGSDSLCTGHENDVPTTVERTGTTSGTRRVESSSFTTNVVIVSTIVLTFLLIIVFGVICVMFYQKSRVQKKYEYGTGRSVLTFINPNYSGGAGSTTPGDASTPGGSGSTGSGDKKPALWKRIKYDKSQDRVYEDKTTLNSPEITSLIPGSTPSPMPSPTCVPLSQDGVDEIVLHNIKL